MRACRWLGVGLVAVVPAIACGGGGTTPDSDAGMTHPPPSDGGGTWIDGSYADAGNPQGDAGNPQGDGGKNDGGAQSAASIPLANIFADGACSGKPGDASLTAGFANASQIAYIVPYGLMTLAHITPVDHMYVYYPSQAARALTDYPVVSPGDGYVRSVSKLDSDYRVVIEHSCDVWSVYIHVQTLSGPLASLDGQVTFQKGWFGSIPIKAGDAFATDGGQPGYDYSLHDNRVTLPGLRPVSYAQSETWKLHTVDPFDYIPEPKKSEILAKNLRSASPRAGKIDYDAAGKATGNWFVVGTNGYAGDPKNYTTGPINPKQMRGYWDTHLALAPNAIDPTHFIASIGNFDGNAVQYVTDQDPALITVASGPVALKLYSFEYQKPDGTSALNDMMNASYSSGVTLRVGNQLAGVLLVQAQADGTLKVEKRPGSTASTSTTFGTDVLIYEH